MEAEKEYDYAEILALRIKKYRIAKQLTLKDLSKMTGISSSALHRYEAKQTEPSYSSLNKISKALEIPISYFVADDDSKIFPDDETMHLSHIMADKGIVIGYDVILDNYIVSTSRGECSLTTQELLHIKKSITDYAIFQFNSLLAKDEFSSEKKIKD